MIDLSILICSTHTRYKTFGKNIQDQVWDQYNTLPPEYQDRIEILMLTDNKKMMLGHKRNCMVDIAQGQYVQFIDDDDRIEPDMFRSVLDAITESHADVITFLVSVSLNGEYPKPCKYSRHFTEDRNFPDHYERLPNHICVVNRELAMMASFPNILYGEDSAYSKLLAPHLESEYQISRVLYHYDYDIETTEAQEHQRASLRVRNRPPIVDVIFLSNAKNAQLKRMTQRAISTCVAGANSLPVNVIVMEQQDGVIYQHANTIHAPEEFHYNQFANRAARYGQAEWIMIANNDLVFTDGWLHNLLAANHPVVSPKCPKDIRQAHITTNATGYANAVNFSGWCFMIKRELWQRIGGFDSDFGFWCADDAVIEQLKAIGVAPMLVPASEVRHLGSMTLHTLPKQHDDLTWRYIDMFNHKYGQDKFAGDNRFEKWKLAHGAVK